MLSVSAHLLGPHRTAAAYRRTSESLPVRKQAATCPGCSYCGAGTTSSEGVRITSSTRALAVAAAHPVHSVAPVKLLFNRISTALSTLTGPETLRPLQFHNVSTFLWDEFNRRYASHPGLTLGSKWEYSASLGIITVVALATPFHDIAPVIMSIQNTRLLLSGVDTLDRFERLHVNRTRLSKLTASGSRSDREPDCAVLALDYHLAIPTIVWEVGHSQGLPSLVRRAKMWCRRYDGGVRVVVLIKYLRQNPRIDRAARLWVYRPHRRAVDGRWTAVQDGPVYTLFPVPPNAGAPEDAIPLTYEDYFGPGNVGVGVDAGARCDLPLQLVRREIDAGIQKTLVQESYRHVSGESTVVGATDKEEEEEEEEEDEPELESKERDDSPEGEAYQEYGDNWDEGMSDVSDA